jgi:osmoprotectant transport system permease protein
MGEYMIQQFLLRFGEDIGVHTFQHMYLTFISLTLSACIAIPLGIYLTKTRCKKFVGVIMNLANIVQTIPTLALLALTVALFIMINRVAGGAEWYREGGLFPTIGRLPAITALVLYALLPILRNTYTGIKQVDSSLLEVARSMGMSQRQIMTQVELPLALPFIMAGVRISAVWTIGIATLCGLIGAGGLGDLILIGLRSNRFDYLLAGTIPAAILALIFDGLMSLLERWLTPIGLRTARGIG